MTVEGRGLLLMYALSALVCAFTPLADHLGFEFAALLTLVCAVTAPFVGYAAMRRELAVEAALRRPASAAARAGLFAVAALLLPMALILLNGLRRPLCDPVAGAIWMALLPAPTAWLGATLGALAGQHLERRRTAVGAVMMVAFVSVLVAIARVYLGPAVFVLDHFAGYFPGPLYDVVIPVSFALVSFRVATVAWGAAAVATAGALGTGDAATSRMHAGWAIGLVLVLGAVTWGWGPSLGWRTSDASLRRALGGEVRIDRLVLHFPSDIGEQPLEQLMRDAAFAAAQVERALGDTTTVPTHIWYYDDPKERRRLIGAEYTQIAKPFRREIHIWGGGYPHGSLRHELVHAMAAEFAGGLWSTPGRLLPNVALIEGFATAYELDDETLTPVQSARALRDLGRAPDLALLLSPLGFLTESGSRAYAYAGAFIRYLDGRFGTTAMRTLYGTGDLSTLGDVTTLIADFERMLDTVQTDANARSSAARRHAEPSIVRQVCAREVEALLDSARALATNRQWDAAQGMLDVACALQPDDPQLRRRKLGVALQRRPRDMEEVLATAEALWAHPQLDEELEAGSRVDVGNELWRRGDVSAAAAQYRLAAALPAGPSTRNMAAERLHAIEDPFRREVLRPLLAGYDQSMSQTLRMADALAARPTDAFLTYLLARQYQWRGAWDRTAQLMERAERLGLASDDLTREALTVLVQSRARENRCDEADAARARLERASGSRTDVAIATDWVERCRFAVARGWAPL